MGGGRVWVNSVAQLAVPLFFATTGYFLYSDETGVLLRRIERSLRKLLPILLVLQLLYSFVPYGWTQGASWGYYLKWLLVGMNRNQVHLWYLTALVTVLATLWVMLRLCGRRALAALMLLGCSCLVLHYLLAGYVYAQPKASYWQAPLWYWWRYVWAMGLGCVSLGLLVARYELQLRQLPSLGWWTLLALLSAPALELLRSTALSPWVPLLQPILLSCSVILIFTLALRVPQWGAGTLLHRLGRHYSAQLYYLHILVLWGVCWLLPPADYVPWAWLLTVLATLVLSQILRYGAALLRPLVQRLL